MPEETIHLHFSDLKLLMENYQNVIQLNTLLLEQQKQISDLQKEIVKSQTTISDRQSKADDKVSDIINKIDIHTDTVQQLNKAVKINVRDLDVALHNRFDIEDKKIDDTKTLVNSMNLDMVKQHSGLTNKIYIALVGSGVIILALIGMLTTSLEKLKVVENLNSMVQKIMVFLNVGGGV